MYQNIQVIDTELRLIRDESNSITQILSPFILMLNYTDITYDGSYASFVSPRGISLVIYRIQDLL